MVSDIPANMQRECGLPTDVEEAVFTQITAAVEHFSGCSPLSKWY